MAGITESQKTLTTEETIYCSQGMWKGKQVWVDHQEIQHCPVEGHALQMLDDEHGPIGYLMCPLCGGYAEDEELCEQLYAKKTLCEVEGHQWLINKESNSKYCISCGEHRNEDSGI